MASAKLNIVLDEGTAWTKRIVWTDANNNAINLTNYWVRSSIKKAYSDSDAVLLATTDETTTLGSVINITPASGIIDIVFSAGDIQSAINAGLTQGVWDLEVVPPEATVTYGGSYTTCLMTLNTGAVIFTANDVSANYVGTWDNASGDRLIVRGSAQDGGIADGYYMTDAVTTNTMSCHVLSTNTGFVGGSTANPSIVLIKPNTYLAQRVIGGGVSITKSVTTAEAHPFN